MSEDLVYRLRKRAEIRRQITSRKSVQEGKPDRIADLLEEAAEALAQPEQEAFTLDRGCWERGCCAYDTRDGDGVIVYVDPVNMSQERVDETAKCKQEPVEMFKHWSLNWLVGKYYGTYISNGLSRIHIWNETTGNVSPREVDAGWQKGDDLDHTESLEDYQLAVKICDALNAPQKREWVGLTDREITKIGNLDWDSAYVGIWYDFARSIEAKLKEKNT
jgi:hypothetical protein